MSLARALLTAVECGVDGCASVVKHDGQIERGASGIERRQRSEGVDRGCPAQTEGAARLVFAHSLASSIASSTSSRSQVRAAVRRPAHFCPLHKAAPLSTRLVEPSRGSGDVHEMRRSPLVVLFYACLLFKASAGESTRFVVTGSQGGASDSVAKSYIAMLIQTLYVSAAGELVTVPDSDLTRTSGAWTVDVPTPSGKSTTQIKDALSTDTVKDAMINAAHPFSMTVTNFEVTATSSSSSTGSSSAYASPPSPSPPPPGSSGSSSRSPAMGANCIGDSSPSCSPDNVIDVLLNLGGQPSSYYTSAALSAVEEKWVEYAMNDLSWSRYDLLSTISSQHVAVTIVGDDASSSSGSSTGNMPPPPSPSPPPPMSNSPPPPSPSPPASAGRRLATDDHCLTEAACRTKAQELGLLLGGGSSAFTGAFTTKGCYAYSSGSYSGRAFWGTGGSVNQMQAAVSPPKYRPCLTPSSGGGKATTNGGNASTSTSITLRIRTTPPQSSIGTINLMRSDAKSGLCVGSCTAAWASASARLSSVLGAALPGVTFSGATVPSPTGGLISDDGSALISSSGNLNVFGLAWSTEQGRTIVLAAIIVVAALIFLCCSCLLCCCSGGNGRGPRKTSVDVLGLQAAMVGLDIPGMPRMPSA